MSSRNHNSSYWKQRAQALEALEHQNAAQYEQTLRKAFYKASAQMQREIESWYQRFADSEGITLPEAKRLLNTRELEEFRWTVEDYIRAGEENALNGNWLRQLENASAKVHISRLESLQLQLQQKIEQLFQNHLDGLDQLLRRQYGEQYYHAAFELMQGTGVGVSFQRFDESFLDRLIDRPWTADGKTFSDRIWENQGKLLSTLQTELIQAAVLGRAAQKTAKAVAEAMEVSLHRARTLVYTESAYFSARADRDAYRRLGVEQYEILATLDLRTSEICRQMDGKVFSMGEFEPGITAPPFHPNCRTTTVPYFEDDMGERIARGADGKTYYVPGDMTYREWENKFVKQAGDFQDAELTIKPITQNSIQRVPLVESKILGEKKSSILQERHKELLTQMKGQPAGTEGFGIYDLELQEISKGIGEKLHVSVHLPEGGEYIFIHNHPSGEMFSHADIIRFLDEDGMKILTAVGNDGTVYLIEKLPEYHELEMRFYISDYLEDADALVKQQDIQGYLDNMEQLIKEMGRHGVEYHKGTV